MTCAKTRVRVTLTHPDGRSWVGENRCRNPQAVCPRNPGEDYTKCRTICDQVGHAELDALAAAGEQARGCTASLDGHTYYCMECQHALFAAGVVALLAPGDDARRRAYNAIADQRPEWVAASLGDVQVDARPQLPLKATAAMLTAADRVYERRLRECNYNMQDGGRTQMFYEAWSAMLAAAMSSTPNPIQGEGEETELPTSKSELPTSNVHRALPSRTARNSAKDADGVKAPAEGKTLPEIMALVGQLEAAVFATEGDPAHPQVVAARDAVRDAVAAYGVTVAPHQTVSPSDADALQTAGKNVKESDRG